jgi:hypothetical protein
LQAAENSAWESLASAADRESNGGGHSAEQRGWLVSPMAEPEQSPRPSNQARSASRANEYVAALRADRLIGHSSQEVLGDGGLVAAHLPDRVVHDRVIRLHDDVMIMT